MSSRAPSVVLPLGLAAVALLLACGAPGRDGATPATATPDSIPRDSLTTATAPATDSCYGSRPASKTDATTFAYSAGDTLATGQPWDPGVGILRVRSKVDGLGTDSLTLRQTPDLTAPIVARLLDYSAKADVGSTVCRVTTYLRDGTLLQHKSIHQARIDAIPELAVDSISADSAWVRVAFATDTPSVVHHGWVETNGRAEYLSWPRAFAKAGDVWIYFVDSQTRANPLPSLRASPDGAPVQELPEGAAPGQIWLDRVEGEWGRVYFLAGDPCGDQDFKRIPGTFWIKLVDRRGRPRFILPMEGC
jgi:hypothetical protein